MPELAVGDVLGSVRREIERSALRARNGIKYVTGGEWAPLAPTPSDVVWGEGKVRLRRYRRQGAARLGPPVLCFLGLVGRAYVFDLWKDNSIVALLTEAGFSAAEVDEASRERSEAALLKAAGTEAMPISDAMDKHNATWWFQSITDRVEAGREPVR